MLTPTVRRKFEKVEQRFIDEHSRDGSGTAAKRRYSVQPDTEVEEGFKAPAANALIYL